MRYFSAVLFFFVKYHKKNLGFLESCFERFVKVFKSWDNLVFDVVVCEDSCGSFKLLFDLVKTLASFLHSIFEGYTNPFVFKLILILINEVTKELTKVLKVIWDIGQFEKLAVFVSVHKCPHLSREVSGVSTNKLILNSLCSHPNLLKILHHFFGSCLFRELARGNRESCVHLIHAIVYVKHDSLDLWPQLLLAGLLEHHGELITEHLELGFDLNTSV